MTYYESINMLRHIFLHHYGGIFPSDYTHFSHRVNRKAYPYVAGRLEGLMMRRFHLLKHILYLSNCPLHSILMAKIKGGKK